MKTNNKMLYVIP